MTTKERATIAITMGEAGIGPEIIVKALLQKQIYSICHPLVVGEGANVFVHPKSAHGVMIELLEKPK